MAASMTHPQYYVNLKKSNGKVYKLTGVMSDLVVSHPKDEIAEKVTLSVSNVKVGDSWLHSLIALKDKVYVYANTGSGSKEVFRGFVWERETVYDASSNDIKLICYDRLIYLQNSKDNLFFKKGKRTKDVLTSMAKKWGFSISYKYSSISHGKLVYHNETIADIMTSVLNKTKSRTGKKYVIRMEKDVIVIEPEGTNKTIYKIESSKNALAVGYSQTMEGMITKVKIVKAETKGDKETGKYLTVSNVRKNTKEYGTLQEILVKNKDDKLADVKKEAQKTVDKNAKPKATVEVSAVDIPWVRKGSKVYIASGNLKNYYIVRGVEHDTKDNKMYLEVAKA